MKAVASRIWLRGGPFLRHGGCCVHRFGRLRASASSTAMRTATPISTWSRMTLREWSATVGGDLDAAVHRARDA